VAVFGRSRSYTRVRGQNPNQETRAARVQQVAPERYVARAELAAIMGVSLATVDRMVAEGMPSVTWGRPHAPFPAVCGYLLGVRRGEGSVSVTRLPSRRWRAQVYEPPTGKNLSVSKVVGGPGTFATKTEAKRAREKARERLRIVRARDMTVHSFWERWTTDPLFARPKGVERHPPP
jgi:hypothetical protein